jgi:dTDP-4-dehydrorhamnose reductase
VINTAAYTAVDDAESKAGKAFAVNADGPRVLAAACSSHRVPLIHVSTDYVFPGDSSKPYQVDDPVGPRSVYGLTKLAGEDAVMGSGARAWVVRTAWVYGAHGKNFVRTMIQLAGARDTLSVVDDQRGSPTWTADLARGLLELASRIASGAGPRARVLHCTGAGDTTWYGLARAVFEELGTDPDRVRPCKTEDFPRPAPRPAFSVLSNESWRAAGLTPLPDWRSALSAAFPSL